MYLSIEEIKARSEEIEAAASLLMATKALVGKPSAKQWRFFRDSVNRLLDICYVSDLDGLSPVQAAQLKFEVDDTFRRFYCRPGFNFSFPKVGSITFWMR